MISTVYYKKIITKSNINNNNKNNVKLEHLIAATSKNRMNEWKNERIRKKTSKKIVGECFIVLWGGSYIWLLSIHLVTEKWLILN